jgi:hypothetical protein
MSAVNLLQESPKLTDQNPPAAHPLFHELHEQDESLFLLESAAAMLLDLDQKEAENGPSFPR